jgi:hypothetical protein
MKIRISFTVDIDPEVWALEYGLDPSEVRADVQTYIAESVRGELDSRGMTPGGPA